MNGLHRRVAALEANEGGWLTLGELLDRLDGEWVDGRRRPDPRIVAALDELGDD